MFSSTPGSTAASPTGGGDGGTGSGSVTGGSLSFSPSPLVAPNASTAAAGAVFAVLVSCLLAETFTGEGDFEHSLQQFTTTTKLSGWQTVTTENRSYYFALSLKGNAQDFYTTVLGA